MGGDGIYEHPTDGRLDLRLTWREPNPRREQTAQLIQAQLRDAGIDVQLDPAPDFNGINQGDFDVALFGYSGIVTPLIYADIYGTDTAGNVGLYSNPEVDALFERAGQELDPEARIDLLHEIDEILWEDLPVLPLFQVPELVAHTESVDGVEFNGYQGYTTNAHRWARTG
jgi:peptide/nickel transport system substrate-binding protein